MSLHVLAEASERLSDLMRLAEVPDYPGRLAEVVRMRDALDVSLVLLDELLQLMPAKPDSGYAREVAELFGEIGEIAAQGGRAAAAMAGKEGG